MLHTVSIDPSMQVECQRADLCVGEEQRLHPSLGKVVLDRYIVGEVAVVHQRAVDALSERVSTSRVGDSPASRVAMVANPDVSGHVLKRVVADYILCVADDLED